MLEGKCVNKISEQLKNIKVVTQYDINTLIDEFDTVKFGSYPQRDISGNIKDAIEWIVLEKQENKALLLSKYILDCKFYDDRLNDSEKEDKYIPWEECSLRNWLNEDFYNNAFNDDEKSKILITSLANNKDDKVFILSLEEIKEYFGYIRTKEILKVLKIDVNLEFSSEMIFGKNLWTKGTDYAKNADNNGYKLKVLDFEEHFKKAKKIFDSKDLEHLKLCDGNSNFLVRKKNPYYIDSVPECFDIFTVNNGFYVNSGSTGVRPALWISY